MRSPLTSLSTFALVCAFALPAQAAPETYNLDPNHTNVYWHASHFGFAESSGKFTDVAGTLVLDEEKPETSTVEVTFQAQSLDTGIPKFDAHLKSKDFFDAEKFPTITFKSTKVEVTGEKTAKVSGDLTLHGVTKPATLEMTLNKIGTSMAHRVKSAGFSGSTTIKRSEFGMGYGVPGIPDDVRITIDSEANLASGDMEMNKNGSRAADK